MNPIISASVLQHIKDNAAAIDHDGQFPQQEFKWLADAGLLAVSLPGRALPAEKNTAGLLQLLKTIGRASLPVGRIYEGHINALYLIHLFGTPAQKQFWFTEANQHKQLFGVWNTQDAGGVRLHQTGSGRYRLEGAKTFCSGANWLNYPVITGELVSETQKGWQMCVISKEKLAQATADSSFWKPLGMKSSASFRMDFTGIELTDEDLLGPPDAYYQQPYFSGGAIRFAAVQLGGAEAVLEAAHQFLCGANRAGDAFQQARLGEMSYLVETGNLWLNQAGNKTDEWLKQPDTTEQILAYANMTRTAIEEICLRVMQLAERSVGSRGFIRPQVLERVHRDLTTYLRQPAPDATLTAIGRYVSNQSAAINLWNSTHE